MRAGYLSLRYGSSQRCFEIYSLRRYKLIDIGYCVEGRQLIQRLNGYAEAADAERADSRLLSNI